jgi:hypothetical protein
MKIEILKASRSWSNESEGMNMAGCLAIDGRVACYFPTDSAMEKHAPLLAAAPEMLAALKGLLADRYLADPINDCRMAKARAAIAKAERGGE